jgi:hypothetical protein
LHKLLVSKYIRIFINNWGSRVQFLYTIISVFLYTKHSFYNIKNLEQRTNKNPFHYHFHYIFPTDPREDSTAHLSKNLTAWSSWFQPRNARMVQHTQIIKCNKHIIIRNKDKKNHIIFSVNVEKVTNKVNILS